MRLAQRCGPRRALRAVMLKSMWLVGGCALLAGCATDGDWSSNTTRDALLASPEDYEGSLLRVTGEPSWNASTTAVACEDPAGPCNNVMGSYAYGDPREGGIEIRATEEWAYEPARGSTPLDCFDDRCTNGVAIGCHGNDVEAVCAPAVPAAIEALYGSLSRESGRWVFRVTDVDLAGAPGEQDDPTATTDRLVDAY
jgi:hypothetical protein